jgi:hypothetical protein
MRPVTLKIIGKFWDSQIYSGELTLFDDEGAIYKLDWSKAIDEIAVRYADVQTGIRVAFSDSDLFYNNKVRRILLDPEIKAPIIRQLEQLSIREYSVSSEFLAKYNSPFDFLPTDTEMYYHKLFAGDETGLYSASRAGKQGRFESEASKHHDARVFQIKASDSFTSIAAAFGDDGLFEFDFNRSNSKAVLNAGTKLANRPCSACDWAFQSVMGWTSNTSFFVNYFETDKSKDPGGRSRVIDRVYEEKDMFGSVEQQGSVWGAREKMYRLNSNGISVSNYSKGKKLKDIEKQAKIAKNKSMPGFEKIGFVAKSFIVDEFVSAGTAPFGTVLEFDEKIVVLRSDGMIDHFDGEPVQWRIFPRSSNYSNQLHIIYEDYLLIISFVHDYFVDQSEKLLGFSKKTKAIDEDALDISY